MEYPNKENIPETVLITQELNENSSITTSANFDNSNEIMIENMHTTSSNDKVLENNRFNEQNADNTVCNNHTQTNLEVKDTYHEEVNVAEATTDEVELNKGDARDEAEQPIEVSEGILSEVTEVVEETVLIADEERQGNHLAEFTSEYMLQPNTENVCISEEHINVESSEVYSAVSDVSPVNNIPDQIVEQSNAISVDPNETQVTEINSISQVPEKNHEHDENLSEVDQVNLTDQFSEPDIKNENVNVNIEETSNIIPEIDNQTVSKNLSNEAPPEENIEDEMPLDSSIENVAEDYGKDVGGSNECSQVVKEEEINSTQAEENDSVVNKEQAAGNISESFVEESVVCSNNGMVETIDLATPSAGSSENISDEGYTITEGMDITEVQEGEYTIVEGPTSLDISTNQHEEIDNSEETWVLLQNYKDPEDNISEAAIEEQNQLNELRSESGSRLSVTSQISEHRPRRGRKPTYDIPMHVLGHDISKPVESVSNGRAVPKPRLGVKVPYRNLTSQIVSKAEIEKEVMERVRLRQEQAHSKGDVIFARKLTQRLARKIAPSPDPPRKPADSKKHNEPNTQIQRENEVTPEDKREAGNKQIQDNSKIHNDSDLLAILEGEGDEMPVLPKEVSRPQVDDSNIKMLEREIALQQLQQLPHQTPKHRIYRGRQVKPDVKAPVLVAEATVSSKNKSSDKSDAQIRETSTLNRDSVTKPRDEKAGRILSDKENEIIMVRPMSKEGPSVSPKSDKSSVSSPKKQPVDIEPQVKVNMVLKTYSRKRKTIELPESMSEFSLPKRTMFIESGMKIEKEKPDVTTPTNVYVTKSSRVIKRKVIWDPDETPSRSPKLATKSDVHSSKMASVKIVKSIEKPINTEKIAERKSLSEKVFERKSNEKTEMKSASPSDKIIMSRNDGLKGKIAIKNKKTRSEVDKLLMDEGAVKMLYDLKNNDESAPKKKKDVYSVDKAHKEIIKKANEIKSDLQQNTSNESPKSLRKKDAFTPSPTKPAQISYGTERKMSKDSTRSSLQTPPGSPAYSQSSMLVRRRSSSSISSSDEVDENDASKISRKKSLAVSTDSKSKKNKKNDINEPSERSGEENDSPVKSAPIETKSSPYKSFTIKKTGRHVAIDLNYINEKCYCTVQVLGELTTALNKYAKDQNCHIVSLTSSSTTFCLGLDYSSLISDKENELKENATELAEKVREFLICLLNFPKVLIAGIQGDCVGLGVTMLPLFDMVIASDTATFSTSYASLGCVAEAGFLLSPPFFTNPGLAAELLYSTQKLTADDAFRRGLVSRLCWPEKYNETLKNIVVSISKGSKQSLEASKKQLRSHLIQAAETAINSESTVLIEHWISSECQENFARINGSGN